MCVHRIRRLWRAPTARSEQPVRAKSRGALQAPVPSRRRDASRASSSSDVIAFRFQTGSNDITDSEVLSSAFRIFSYRNVYRYGLPSEGIVCRRAHPAFPRRRQNGRVSLPVSRLREQPPTLRSTYAPPTSNRRMFDASPPRAHHTSTHSGPGRRATPEGNAHAENSQAKEKQ